MGLFASDKSSPWHDKASHFTLIKSLDEKWDTWSVKTNLSHANESWQNPVGYFQISICKWNDKRDLWNVKQIEKSRSKFTIRLAVAHKASQHTRADLNIWLRISLIWNICHWKGLVDPTLSRLASVVYNILLNAPSKIPILTFSKFPSLYLSFKKVHSLATSNHLKV